MAWLPLAHAAGKPDCVSCHRSVAAGKHVHDPVLAGECVSCHRETAGRSHQREKGGMGLVETGAQLCYLCHRSMAEGRFVHAPVAAGDCVVCHDPHRSAHPGQLKKGLPELCRQCHEDKFTYAFTHGQAKKGNCLACHDPHQSSRSHLLKQEASALCRSCHGGARFKGESVHLPVEAGDCLACHDPHGSANRVGLKKNFSAAFYLPYKSENYELCFSCHDRALVQDSLFETATNFRDGRINLHALHVNRSDKGRSCKACHDPHAAGQQVLIRKKVPGFGTWSIPISFTRTVDGGSCLVGCHKPRSYSRAKEVVSH